MTQGEQAQYRLGLALVAFCALAWSSSGFFIRLIGADLMTMLFWRGLFTGTAVMLLFVCIERSAAWSILKTMRLPSLLVMIFSASGMITGLGAMRYTTVADAMVIYATVPFVTAGVAYLVIGEKPSRSTLIASGVALIGVVIMLADTRGGSGTLTGKLLAIGMTLSMAGLATTMRRHRGVPLLPAMGASAWLCSAVTFWFARPLGITPVDLGLTALFGVFQNALGLILYTFGSRRIPAAEATLIAALEVPLAPFWVWAVFGETPGRATLIGGLIVLTALFGHITSEVRRTRIIIPTVV